MDNNSGALFCWQNTQGVWLSDLEPECNECNNEKLSFCEARTEQDSVYACMCLSLCACMFVFVCVCVRVCVCVNLNDSCQCPKRML